MIFELFSFFLVSGEVKFVRKCGNVNGSLVACSTICNVKDTNKEELSDTNTGCANFITDEKEWNSTTAYCGASTNNTDYCQKEQFFPKPPTILPPTTTITTVRSSSTESISSKLKREQVLLQVTKDQLNEQLEELEEILREAEETLSALNTTLDLSLRAFKTISCQNIIELLEKNADNILNAERGFFFCLKSKIQNVSCNSTEKLLLKIQAKYMQNGLAEVNSLVSEKINEIKETQFKLDEISKQLKQSETGTTQSSIQSTSMAPRQEILNCTNILDINGTAQVNIVDPTDVAQTYESPDFKVNANNTENVTIVFVVGEAAISKATNVATDTDRSIDVNCCVNGNK